MRITKRVSASNEASPYPPLPSLSLQLSANKHDSCVGVYVHVLYMPYVVHDYLLLKTIELWAHKQFMQW